MGDISGDKRDAMNRWISVLATSAGFLTRLPVGRDMALLRLPEAMAGFPLIGALIGMATGLVLWIFSMAGFPSLIAAGLAIAVTVLITGGLHEDGLADVADGFGGGNDPTRKLEIMRDSRIGTYGVIALVLALLIRASALAEIAPLGLVAVLCMLAGCGAFSRALMVWLLHATPAARSDGLGASASGPDASVIGMAIGLGSVLALTGLWIGAGFVAAVIAIAAAAALSLGVRILSLRQIGGQTGDVCGAVQMIGETAMLAIAAASLS